MSILEAKGLCKTYGSTNILSDVDLQIEKRRICGHYGSVRRR